MRFALVDIETTGGHSAGNGITEIAVIVLEKQYGGLTEVERWERLVDPGVPVPARITALTGIDDALLVGAPPFEQIADELETVLAGSVFVAHNVGFDYAFIRGHFEAMGREWRAPRLCTVRLSRKLLRGHASYSLGALCRDLGIANSARHRAMGDCEATVELFEKILADPLADEVIEDALRRGDRASWLPQHVEAGDYDRLPLSPGVYQFLDKAGKPLYIGMSKNVRNRVRSHFNGEMQSARRQALLRDVYSIVGETTGSVLVARLLEDELIRKHWPVHNRAQKVPERTFAVYRYTDRGGRTRLGIVKGKAIGEMVTRFHSEADAREWLWKLAKSGGLFPDWLGLGDDGRKERPTDAEEHNRLLASALEKSLEEGRANGSYAVMERGRTEGETAIILVDDGRFYGWGFAEEAPPDYEGLFDIVSQRSGSRMADAILTAAIAEHESGKTRLRIFKRSTD